LTKSSSRKTRLRFLRRAAVCSYLPNRRLLKIKPK
jgi:hypothetical protein